MSIYRDEIFGPVLTIVRADDFEDALALPTQHQYGNGAAIFTGRRYSREFTRRVDVGMVGVNVPIPVPIAYYTFGGWKASGFEILTSTRRCLQICHQNQDSHLALALRC